MHVNDNFTRTASTTKLKIWVAKLHVFRPIVLNQSRKIVTRDGLSPFNSRQVRHVTGVSCHVVSYVWGKIEIRVKPQRAGGQPKALDYPSLLCSKPLDLCWEAPSFGGRGNRLCLYCSCRRFRLLIRVGCLVRTSLAPTKSLVLYRCYFS